MYKTIIIEDEPNAQSLLVNICNEYCPNLNVVGMADNVEDALRLFEKVDPDLAFLDIQLSDSLSFELLDKLSNRDCAIIFTTAYDNYALKAFGYEAVDYVMKPYSHLDITKAVKKVKKTPLSSELLRQFSDILGKRSSERIKVQTSGGFILLKSSEVVRIEAEGAYANLHTICGKKYMTSKTLKEYEEKLPKEQFYRVHASHLINMDSVEQIKTEDGCSVILSNGDQIPISRRHKQDFIDVLMHE